MAKTQIKILDPAMDFVFQTKDGNWVLGELKVLQKTAKKIGKTKASARKFLYKHGFVTKSGKLTNAYKA